MRREERELDRPRVVHTSHQVYYMLRRTRVELSKPSQPIVALVIDMGPLGDHRVAGAAMPLRTWDANIAWRQKTFVVLPGKLTLYRASAHPAVKAVVLAVLVRSAGPITHQYG